MTRRGAARAAVAAALLVATWHLVLAPTVAGLCRARGLRADARHDLATAEVWLSRSLRFREEPPVALDLAEVLARRGAVAEAGRLAEATSIRDLDLLGQGRRELLRAHSALAAGLWDDAERAGDSALETARRSRATSEDSRDLEVRALLLLSSVRAHLGDLEAAEVRLSRAEERSAEAEASLAGRVALARGGFLWSHRLRRDDVLEDHLRPALALVTSAGDLQGRADVLARIGLAHYARGEVGRHLELQEEARSLYRRIGDRGGLTDVESYLGVMYAGMERYDLAHEAYARARQERVALGDRLGVRIVDELLADIHLRTGNYEDARETLRTLLEDAPPGTRRRGLLYALGNVDLHRSDPGAAAESYGQALELDLRLSAEDPGFRQRVLVMLGHASRQLGELDRADDAIARSIDMARRHGDVGGRVAAELARADLADRRGDTGTVLEAIETAVDLQDDVLETPLTPFVFTQYEQSLGRLRPLSVRGATTPIRERATELVYRLLEQMRAREFRRLLVDRSRDPRVAEARARLEEAGRSRDAAAATDAHRELRVARLASALARRDPPEPPLDLDTLRRRLPPGRSAVFYAIGGDRLFALLVDAGNARGVALPVSADTARDRIRLLRDLLEEDREGGPAPRPWTDVAVELRRALVDPLEDAGLERGGRVGIVPIGPLAELPFAALARHEGDGIRYLPEDHEIVVAPTATTLVGAPGRDTWSEGVVAVGVRLSAEGPPLPAAEEEARSVAEVGAGRALLGAAATEAAVRKALAGARVVHLAVHGVAEPELPLLSRLLLRPDAEHDGRLLAGEILELERVPELVVLAACRSGAAFPPRSEDWAANDRIGLADAFLRIGTRRVVVALVEIDDAKSARFLVDFHRRVAEGADAPAALAAVQRAAIRRSDGPTWAAFAVLGAG